MPSAYDITALTVDMSLAAVIIFSNILTTVAVAKFRYLQTITNIFTVNLACADICVGLAVPLCSLVNNTSLFKEGAFLLSCRLCKSMTTTSLGVSLTCLFFISLDRYFTIFYPLKYINYVTRYKAWMIVIATWTAFITLSPSLLFTYNTSTNKCATMYLIPRRVYYGALITPVIIFVLLTIIIYSRIFHIARKQQNQIRVQEMAVGHFTTRETKLTKMMALILGIYILSFIPYVIVSIVRLKTASESESLEILWKTSLTLVVGNSMVNPVIYGWKNASFRKAYLHLLNLKCLMRNNDCKNSGIPDSVAREVIQQALPTAWK